MFQEIDDDAIAQLPDQPTTLSNKVYKKLKEENKYRKPYFNANHILVPLQHIIRFYFQDVYYCLGITVLSNFDLIDEGILAVIANMVSYECGGIIGGKVGE
ncbi:MAG TPA: hypothetical protein VE971_06175 [Candidatus Eisenbacteria bacterium]|nr:hypothetical protein [Candidatus Eisenbacteria bacterium]